MDPLVEIASFSALAVITAALIQYFGSRSQVAFIERVQEDLGTERTERIRLGARVESLEQRNGHLEHINEEMSAYIVDLTNWGMTTVDPIPRTPPSRRKRVHDDH